MNHLRRVGNPLAPRRGESYSSPLRICRTSYQRCVGDSYQAEAQFVGVAVGFYETHRDALAEAVLFAGI